MGTARRKAPRGHVAFGHEGDSMDCSGVGPDSVHRLSSFGAFLYTVSGLDGPAKSYSVHFRFRPRT